MKKYPILYSRDSHGNIRTWQMVQSGDSYKTISGILNGSLVETEPTICLGKNIGRSNETTPKSQSEAEIEAKYRKQLAQGGYWEDVRDIDKTTYFSPQLAKNYPDRKDKIDWDKGVFVSEKLDGIRCITTRLGMTSRNGKKIISAPHIFESLKSVFEESPDLILDSELYCSRLSDNFNKIISLAKQTKPTSEDLVESEKWLELHVFDIPSFDYVFEQRWKMIEDFYRKQLINNKYIKLVKHEKVSFEEDVDKKLSEYLSAGVEGIMVNLPDYKYENKRSAGLLKYKQFDTNEYLVKNITEGSGNRSSLFGFATLEMDNGKTFDANARGDENYYKELLINKDKYINTYATVRHQGFTSDEKVPRFPVVIDFNRMD